MSSARTYNTSDVCWLAGLTKRQLDYWLQKRLIVPSVALSDGTGHSHRWSVKDARAARAMRRLRDSGVAVERLGHVQYALVGIPLDQEAVLILLPDGTCRAAYAQLLPDLSELRNAEFAWTCVWVPAWRETEMREIEFE